MISQEAFTSGRGLLGTILSKMSCIGKVKRTFLSHILLMFISMRGRINFLQLERYGHMDEHSYRYQFSKEFDWLGFNYEFVKEQCSDDVILGFDASYISKHRYKSMVVLFGRVLDKIEKLIPSIHDDLQFDYRQKVEQLEQLF
jgi:hypothetical protein